MTAHDIYTALFDRIIRNTYAEETWLREDVLAREFNVSRSPIRTVLRNLEQDHLVEILPKRGARVFPFTGDDLEDIYELRESLELLALRRAANTIGIQRLLDIRSEIQALEGVEDYRRHAKVDAELHGYLTHSSGRRRLITMLNQIYRLTQTFREISLQDVDSRSATIREHVELIDALCIRDVARASELLATHIRNARIRALTRIIQGKVDSPSGR